MGTFTSSPGSSFTISNDLLSQLLVGMRTEAVDNLFRKSAFLDAADKAGAIDRVSAASVWAEPLAVAEHSRITQVSTGFEALDMTVSDVMNPAQYSWCGFHAPILISRKEELENSGEAQIVKILETRLSNVMGVLRREIEKQIVADSSTVLTNMNSLYGGYSGAAINNGFLYCDTAGTAGTVGGLARSTALGLSNIVVNATTATSVVEGLTQAWIQASDQAARGEVGLILAGSTAFQLYKNELFANEQYVNPSKLDGGTLALSFHGAPVVYSSWMDTSKTTGGSSTLDRAFYGINFDHIRLKIHPDADFATSDFVDFPTQAVRGAKFDCLMQLTANHLGSSFAVIDAV